ncbi:MarR family winged helix-turn-helix transcriptional regulator [Agrococcus jejuensis]|uniref:DNA-binding transcriptional regulator, MarR family n=1 Tax=Agrococcus jejuensis TaxID=399736 RepID=A0A1G8DX24_9MICO|nr:MarR family transcriptional regulator [Agrococcus jejuensis]SDH62214.1 DNA-binding transcriptional regulator, MarR family [Agrococcus jejuensis]
MTEAAARIQESRELAVLAHRTAALARADFARAVAPHGVTPPMARVLLLLAEPMPMRRIAERLLCDASYVTGVADLLEDAGLAERTAGTDRRVKLLAATSRGAEVRVALAGAVADESTVLRALDDAERAQLRVLLGRLLATTDAPVEVDALA